MEIALFVNMVHRIASLAACCLLIFMATVATLCIGLYDNMHADHDKQAKNAHGHSSCLHIELQKNNKWNNIACVSEPHVVIG